MANVLGGQAPNAKQTYEYTGLQLQTSTQGLCIPIVWGCNVASPNIVWINGFYASAANGKGAGKGGGGGKGASQYNYSAAVELALCEGPITNIGKVWQNGTNVDGGDNQLTLNNAALTFNVGSATQTAPGFITSRWPTQALPYAYTAFLWSSSYPLSGGATLPSLKVEVIGLLSNPGALVGVTLTAGVSVGSTVLPVSSTAGIVVGDPVNGNLVGGSHPVSSGIPGGTRVAAINPGVSITLDTPTGLALPFGLFITVGWLDINIATVVYDYLTNPQYGVQGFPAAAIDSGSFALFQTYCQAQGLFFSPALVSQEQGNATLQRWVALANTWIFWSGNLLKFVPLGDTAITANGATYTPNTAPIYDLSIDDFIFDPKSEAPVTVTRVDPVDGYNRVELDVRDRGNGYVSTPIYWEDQATIDQFGLLQSNTVSASEVCDIAVAAVMAQLIGQRSVFIRNTYAFKLPPTFVLLETGDIVTLTEPNLGLSAFPVRIKTIDEDEQMMLSVTAEEFPGSVGSVLYPRPHQSGAAAAGGFVNTGVDAGDVNPPLIFEPSVAVTGGTPQVWIGASGGPNWGGAVVYISTDGTNYALIGQISHATQQGVLTAVLPAAGDPDLTDTLAVDMTESGSTLSTAATTANADAYQTAALIDSEVIAYGTVVATGTYTANLTYLRRGGFGTTPASHAIGAQFSRINPSAVFIYTLPQADVGKTLYVKLCSVNVFGSATQPLSEAVAYTYVPTGVAYTVAPPTNAVLSASTILQPDGTTRATMLLAWTASTGAVIGSYEVQFSSNAGASWSVDMSIGPSGTSAQIASALSGAPYQARVRAIGANGLAISSWATSAIVTSGTIGPIVVPPAGVTPLPGGARRRLPADEDAPEQPRRRAGANIAAPPPPTPAPPRRRPAAEDEAGAESRPNHRPGAPRTRA